MFVQTKFVYMKKIATLLSLILCMSLMHAQLGKKLGKITKKENVQAAAKGAKAVSLSDKEVMQLSAEAVKWMDENNPIADPNTDPYGIRLKKLVKNHLNEDGLNLNFKVYRVVDVNAFATADGSVRVMAGLMELMNDDELLAVIGHEIGHVKNKHTKKQMKKAYALSAAKDAAAANSKSGSVLKDSEMAGLMENLANAQFSQTDESESDTYSFAFMVKHGYDYHAVESAFNKLAELSGNGGKGNIMSSHPGSAKRAKRAKKWANKQDKK